MSGDRKRGKHQFEPISPISRIRKFVYFNTTNQHTTRTYQKLIFKGYEEKTNFFFMSLLVLTIFRFFETVLRDGRERRITRGETFSMGVDGKEQYLPSRRISWQNLRFS